MTFKNDKERILFLEAYKDDENPYAANWSIWKRDDILGRRFWATHVGTTIFFVEEEYITISWPKPHKHWATRNWFIYEGPEMKDSFSQEVTFGDRRASRTQALQRLKELEKEARHG